MRIRLQEYHGMIEAGVLNENHRVELLDACIVAKKPHNPSHDGMIDVVLGEIEPFLPSGWFARVQAAITTLDSGPEPDIAIVRGPRGRYGKAHPQGDEIGMVIEVADSSLHQDRNHKAPVYGQAKIPIYWIVNIPDRRVEIHSEPSGPDPNPGYHQSKNVGKGEAAPLVLDGKELGQILVDRLFVE